MASAFRHGETESGGWAHRFWKKARIHAAGKSSRASHDNADNAGAGTKTTDGHTAPQRRHQMKLSDYQKQMHQEARQTETDQPQHPPKEN
jgi:hypothetical protein